jgi:hypothetical protein
MNHDNVVGTVETSDTNKAAVTATSPTTIAPVAAKPSSNKRKAVDEPVEPLTNQSTSTGEPSTKRARLDLNPVARNKKSPDRPPKTTSRPMPPSRTSSSVAPRPTATPLPQTSSDITLNVNLPPGGLRFTPGNARFPSKKISAVETAPKSTKAAEPIATASATMPKDISKEDALPIKAATGSKGRKALATAASSAAPVATPVVASAVRASEPISAETSKGETRAIKTPTGPRGSQRPTFSRTTPAPPTSSRMPSTIAPAATSTPTPSTSAPSRKRGRDDPSTTENEEMSIRGQAKRTKVESAPEGELQILGAAVPKASRGERVERKQVQTYRPPHLRHNARGNAESRAGTAKRATTRDDGGYAASRAYTDKRAATRDDDGYARKRPRHQ